MRLISSMLLGLLGVAFAQDKPVPVDQEPHHRVVLKNELVQVMHVTLSPGERTLYHTHSHDRAAVELSKCSITQQKLGDPEGTPSANQPGDLSISAEVSGGFCHRVHNVSSDVFEVLDVEFLQRPQDPSAKPTIPVAGENPSARAYRWTLAPGAKTPEHSHTRPYLIIAATSMQLRMTAPDGQSSVHMVKSGDFHWVDTPVAHSLGNDGAHDGQIVEIELK